MLLRNSYCDIIIITLDVLWHACWIQHFLYVHYMQSLSCSTIPIFQILRKRRRKAWREVKVKRGDLDHEIGVRSPRRDGGRGQCVSG